MPPKLTPQAKTIKGVLLGGVAPTDPEATWDITIEYPPDRPDGVISSITPSGDSASSSPLALPALVHPHIHLDKAYVHNTPAYNHLLPVTGSFQEALASTTQAKAKFTRPDLLKRGAWLLAESVTSGVTAMRAFVEVDHTVQHTCLEAGLTLKHEWRDSCQIQLVCFAQDPIFSTEHGDENRRLVEAAIRGHASAELSVLGTTPYVESSIEASKRNIEWAVDLALETDRHLDFHLDYNLSPPDVHPEPLIWHVLHTLREKRWTSGTTNRRVMLGHCTRLSQFTGEDWKRLAKEIQEHALPVSFVGLPTSDLYMADIPSGGAVKSNPRGTLPVPEMVRKHGLDAVIAVNNVGNAFTPWGSADPLNLACLGVGVYQAGTIGDAELLYECVSTRARAAIGLSPPGVDSGVRLRCGDHAEILVLHNVDDTGCLGDSDSRSRKSLAEVVWDPPSRASRAVVCRGHVLMPALPTRPDAAFRSGV
ncbi:putative zinc metallopeptidase [Aspergillus lucknowensis]|uniref:Metallo-dependent hydrolase n=1 Tax=Aspergillus lucknowensis TaxID=176173 RepID=A0ABR4LRE6_9EURO